MPHKFLRYLFCKHKDKEPRRKKQDFSSKARLLWLPEKEHKMAFILGLTVILLGTVTAVLVNDYTNIGGYYCESAEDHHYQKV